MPKKKFYQDDERAGDPPTPNPYAGEQWFPSALIGKALGTQAWKDKYPKPDPAGKGDLPAGVTVSDIRSKYKKPGKGK